MIFGHFWNCKKWNLVKKKLISRVFLAWTFLNFLAHCVAIAQISHGFFLLSSKEIEIFFCCIANPQTTQKYTVRTKTNVQSVGSFSLRNGFYYQPWLAYYAVCLQYFYTYYSSTSTNTRTVLAHLRFYFIYYYQGLCRTYNKSCCPLFNKHISFLNIFIFDAEKIIFNNLKPGTHMYNKQNVIFMSDLQ